MAETLRPHPCGITITDGGKTVLTGCDRRTLPCIPSAPVSFSLSIEADAGSMIADHVAAALGPEWARVNPPMYDLKVSTDDGRSAKYTGPIVGMQQLSERAVLKGHLADMKTPRSVKAWRRRRVLRRQLRRFDRAMRIGAPVAQVTMDVVEPWQRL